jgi:hypothetical protein
MSKLKKTKKFKLTREAIITTLKKPETVKEESPIIVNAKSTKVTQEQAAGVPPVVNKNFETVKRIDHLPFKEQINQIFNPLQAITKTDISDSPSEATFIVEAKAKSKG